MSESELDDFDQWMRHCDAVAEANGIRHSTWDVDTCTKFEARHPYDGATKLIYRRSSTAIKGDRWLDLWLAADKLIGRSRDLDHRFIEEFVRTPESGVLEIWVGS